VISARKEHLFLPAPAPLRESRLVSNELSGVECRTRVEADGHVLRVERAQGHEECEGFAILIEHMLMRVNNEIFERGESVGSDPQLS